MRGYLEHLVHFMRVSAKSNNLEQLTVENQ